MAPKKKPAEKKQNWVRTGGFIGDEAMTKLDTYLDEGCGVDESEEVVGNTPNEKFLGSKPMPGRID